MGAFMVLKNVSELAYHLAVFPPILLWRGIRLPLLLKMWHGQAHCPNIVKELGFPSVEDILRG